MKSLSEHYRSIGETYIRHMGEAIFISIKLFIAALACMVHAVFPFMFETTASSIIENILKNIGSRKSDIKD